MGKKRDFEKIDGYIKDLKRKGYTIMEICEYFKTGYKDEINISGRRDLKKFKTHANNV